LPAEQELPIVETKARKRLAIDNPLTLGSNHREHRHRGVGITPGFLEKTGTID